jgi:hypothetical protein
VAQSMKALYQNRDGNPEIDGKRGIRQRKRGGEKDS